MAARSPAIRLFTHRHLDDWNHVTSLLVRGVNEKTGFFRVFDVNRHELQHMGYCMANGLPTAACREYEELELDPRLFYWVRRVPSIVFASSSSS